MDENIAGKVRAIFESTIAGEEARLQAIRAEINASQLRIRELDQQEKERRAKIVQLNTEIEEIAGRLQAAEAEAKRITSTAEIAARRLVIEADNEAAEVRKRMKAALDALPRS